VPLPSAIEDLVDELATSDGVTAVVLGGSRAIGRNRPDSDWDLGVYSRGSIDLTGLAARGPVHPPGTWGRIMNGGSWLTIGGVRVDVLLRDLDAVEHWTTEAAAGRFAIDGLPGYVAGIPTYSLAAEVDASQVLRGALTVDAAFPPALRVSGPTTWRINRDFSLDYADKHARRGDVVGTLGMTVRAMFEEAHARCCAAGTWVLNEKHLLATSGLDDTGALLTIDHADHAEPGRLGDLVDTVRSRLER
jgi:hypothetical protein